MNYLDYFDAGIFADAVRNEKDLDASATLVSDLVRAVQLTAFANAYFNVRNCSSLEEAQTALSFMLANAERVCVEKTH